MDRSAGVESLSGRQLIEGSSHAEEVLVRHIAFRLTIFRRGDEVLRSIVVYSDKALVAAGVGNLRVVIYRIDIRSILSRLLAAAILVTTILITTFSIAAVIAMIIATITAVAPLASA